MPEKQKQNQIGESLHKPVLVQEVLSSLAPQPGESFLDITAGYGGHTQAVLDITSAPEKTVVVDRDEQAIAVLTDKFPKARIIHQDFYAACLELTREGAKFDLILADLGISSPHIDIASRGFSFANNGPLDMRMDLGQELSANYFVNEASEEDLAVLIKNYGEEPRAKRIARAIVAGRPVADTSSLAELIANAIGPIGRRRSIHPATRTFQAIRIAVNDELDQVEKSLPLIQGLLAPGGRLAIISFHSLEDRLVKRYFAENAGERYDAELRLITKKPVTASDTEIVINPRARSAKLRAARKIKKERTK